MVTADWQKYFSRERTHTSEQDSYWPGLPAWLFLGESFSETACIRERIYRSSSQAAV